MLYSLNEIFYSIQGEGELVGKAAIFIRFAGCNLNCYFCDTDHSEKMKMSIERIIIACERYHKPKYKNHIPPSNIIVLTGGEPTKQNLIPLVIALRKRGWFIALETNGYDISNIPIEIDWITLSPKPTINYDSKLIQVDELKVVLYLGCEPHKWKQEFRATYYYIQPCSEDFNPAIEFVKENPEWKLSIQIQKLIGMK